VPAHLHLGDVLLRRGQVAEAVEAWEQILEVAPERAYLAFDRLESGYAALGASTRFAEMCRRLMSIDGHDWRARLALGRHVAAERHPAAALELLFEALIHNPHSLSVHQAIWSTLRQLDLEPGLVGRYTELTSQSVFYLDPHVCVHCRYRSTELLWQCPHCREWNSFLEERFEPAKDAKEADG